MPRLLLVEDAPDVALIVGRLAGRMGVDVAHRADTASAWECLRAAPPDLVLLDLNLLGERGEGLCRRVRAAPETTRLPVALSVPWGATEDIVSGLEAGADYVLSKDLLARPAAWQARLGEILAPRGGLCPSLSVHCQRNSLLPHPLAEGLTALNRALRHPLMRQLGSDVLRLILRRAVRRAVPEEEEVPSWLEPDGLALNVPQVAARAPGAAPAVMAAALADQLQRLLGTEVSAPACEALRTAVGFPGG
jgi:DNA-binding response OmpR family regulator